MAIQRLHGSRRITANARVLVADTEAELSSLNALKRSDTGAILIASDTGNVFIIKSPSPLEFEQVNAEGFPAEAASAVLSSSTAASQTIAAAGVFQAITGVPVQSQQGIAYSDGRFTVEKAGRYQFDLSLTVLSAPAAGNQIQLALSKDPDGVPTQELFNFGNSITNYGASVLPLSLSGQLALEAGDVLEMQIANASATGAVVILPVFSSLIRLGA